MIKSISRELHETRERIDSLKQCLVDARGKELPAYRSFIDEQIHSLANAVEEARVPERYRVAVVGRFKVGKSAFVNSLLGERLAGEHINPETAAISIFRYGRKTRAEVGLISAKEWDRLEKGYKDDPENPEFKRYEQFIHFHESHPDKVGKRSVTPGAEVDMKDLLQKWVKPGGEIHEIKAEKWSTAVGKNEFRKALKKFTSAGEPLHYLVNTITIYAPVPILREIELIDTPGLDDTERFRVRLTEELVKDVDAILFLTVSGASYGQSDKDFIVRQLRRRQIKHLQLIVTRCDETFANVQRNAEDDDDIPPTFDDFRRGESERVRNESKSTLDELLQSSQLSEEERCYYTAQLENVPVHLVSAEYHRKNDIERGGIEAVCAGLYQSLSSSGRFERAHHVLSDRLKLVSDRLLRSFNERLNTLETEFDPTKVRKEIKSIRGGFDRRLKTFEGQVGEFLGLLVGNQEAEFETLPILLELIVVLAGEVLSGLKEGDLSRHWKPRRYGRWGGFGDLAEKVADKIFPKVEIILNRFRGHLDEFMEEVGDRLLLLQSGLNTLEAEHNLSGLEPISLVAVQTSLFEDLRRDFQLLEQVRDDIVSKLGDFVTDEVMERFDQARESVSEILGRGTTVAQGEKVSRFYADVRKLLAEALREHLKMRIKGFSRAIRMKAGLVGRKIREASEKRLDLRMEAIESSLKVAAEGRKEEVATYLKGMVEMLNNFTANPETVSSHQEIPEFSDEESDQPLLGCPQFHREQQVIVGVV